MPLPFTDNFATFDTNVWTVYGSNIAYDRTIFGFQPVVATQSGVTYLRLKVDTTQGGYSGDPSQFYPYTGTEIKTNERFAYTSGQGLEFEARCRAAGTTAGLVYGFFPYYDTAAQPYPKEELDCEFIGKPPYPFSQIWTNTWNNNIAWPSAGGATAPGLNWNTWTVCKIRWYAGRVEWYFNDWSARTSTDVTYIPDVALTVHFNAWVPASTFPQAYQATPASGVAYFDVDYLKVSAVSPATPLVTITSPSNSATVANLNTISGTAVASQTGVGPITQVTLQIRRLSDGLFWTGTTWGAQTALPTVVNSSATANTWARSSGNPTGANLAPGNYQLTAIAYDQGGNLRSTGGVVTI